LSGAFYSECKGLFSGADLFPAQRVVEQRGKYAEVEQASQEWNSTDQCDYGASGAAQPQRPHNINARPATTRMMRPDDDARKDTNGFIFKFSLLKIS